MAAAVYTSHNKLRRREPNRNGFSLPDKMHHGPTVTLIVIDRKRQTAHVYIFISRNVGYISVHVIYILHSFSRYVNCYGCQLVIAIVSQYLSIVLLVIVTVSQYLSIVLLVIVTVSQYLSIVLRVIVIVSQYL